MLAGHPLNGNGPIREVAPHLAHCHTLSRSPFFTFIDDWLLKSLICIVLSLNTCRAQLLVFFARKSHQDRHHLLIKAQEKRETRFCQAVCLMVSPNTFNGTDRRNKYITLVFISSDWHCQVIDNKNKR